MIRFWLFGLAVVLTVAGCKPAGVVGKEGR